MNRSDLLKRLDLYDQLVLYQKVKPIANVCQLSSSINQGHGNLSQHIHSCLPQFEGQTCRICAFEQAWPQFRVHPKGRFECPLTEMIELCLSHRRYLRNKSIGSLTSSMRNIAASDGCWRWTAWYISQATRR